MSRHPTKSNNEVFLGNVKVERLGDFAGRFRGICPTLRFADGAQDLNGAPLLTHRACFMSRRDEIVYSNIMEARMCRK